MTSEDQGPVAHPEDIRLHIRLAAIFAPFAARQQRALIKKRTRFVHYTSAKGALGIIQTKRLWMRNARCMSDYSEVEHGFRIYESFFSDRAKKEMFVEALDKCFPGVATEAINLFEQWRNNLLLSTYITSLSTHDEAEDDSGRLSMWRGFGGNASRVAIVLRIPEYSGGASALKLIFSPVAYLTESEAHEVIHEVIKNIHAHRELLRSVGRQIVFQHIVGMLLAGVACLKNVGFQEEREWRAIYLPELIHFRSPLMEPCTKEVFEVPQLIYQIPLDQRVSGDLAGLELSRLLDRLIIGPSSYSEPMREAFVMALTDAGVENAGSRVCISNIPFRG